MYSVTMQITFPISEFARKGRNLHCDVVHITTVWVSRLVLDHLDRSGPDVALKAYRPLSRRLDRCDRVIQNESRDLVSK